MFEIRDEEQLAILALLNLANNEQAGGYVFLASAILSAPEPRN